MNTDTHNRIIELVGTYTNENERFVTKGVKASAARARKALSEMSKLLKVRRLEIQEAKVSLVKE